MGDTLLEELHHRVLTAEQRISKLTKAINYLEESRELLLQVVEAARSVVYNPESKEIAELEQALINLDDQE